MPSAELFNFVLQHSKHGFLRRIHARHRMDLLGLSACRSAAFYSLALAKPCWKQLCRWPHQAKSVCWPAAGSAMVEPSCSLHGCRKYRTRAARHGRLVLATNQSRAMQHASLARRRAWPARRGLTLRSSGAPTAGHQRPAGGTRYILAVRALASCRRRPLSSNVRPRKTKPHHLLPPS